MRWNISKPRPRVMRQPVSVSIRRSCLVRSKLYFESHLLGVGALLQLIHAGTIWCEPASRWEAVQRAADAAGLFFPLDWRPRVMPDRRQSVDQRRGQSRTSVRHGARLGLGNRGRESGAARSSIHLRKIIKNNSRFDVRQLFIGSEGTLEIVAARSGVASSPRGRGPESDAVELARLLVSVRARIGLRPADERGRGQKPDGRGARLRGRRTSLRAPMISAA